MDVSEQNIIVHSRIGTWFPIITRCPLSVLPDFVKVELHCTGFVELYEARKKLRKLLTGKKMFMEDLAKLVLETFPEPVSACTVRLMWGPHIVTAFRE